jgi:hypothetical protein
MFSLVTRHWPSVPSGKDGTDLDLVPDPEKNFVVILKDGKIDKNNLNPVWCAGVCQEAR